MSNVKYPRIHLSLDNCFALKHWPWPRHWGKVVHDIGGIHCIEASTDLEIDPQFCPMEYRRRWVEEMREMGAKYDLQVNAMYSGYATYRSVGLLSPEKSYRDTLMGNYGYATVDIAHDLGANAGSALNAFYEELLDDPDTFRKSEDMLTWYLTRIAQYSGERNVKYCYEQMYTPAQGWWRIKDVERYLKEAQRDAKNALYTTIDTAHFAGHKARVRPSDQVVEECVMKRDSKGVYFPGKIREMIAEGASLKAVKEAMDRYEYMYCDPEDSDVYAWLRRVACYSPCMHLQQTDGARSAHLPFTAVHNATGIIEPKKMFQAIKECYEQPVDPDMPARAEDIHMAFETFFGITMMCDDIIDQLHEQIEYWRAAMPEDGLTVDQLV